MEREPLALPGEKFKKPKLAPLWFQTELAIYQIYILVDRKIFDQTVIAAVERLVREMREGPLPPLPDIAPTYGIDQAEEMLIDNIRRNWGDKLAAERPAKDDLIGVLRSLLSTINEQKAPGSQSQGYLHYITRFLAKQLAVSVQRIPASGVEAQDA